MCHPKQKKTQLFRKNINTYTELDVIFKNPRVHTDKGYQRKTETHSRKKEKPLGLRWNEKCMIENVMKNV